MAQDGQNSLVGSDELRAFIERAERIQADIAAMKNDEKEIFAEAKGRGYDTKIMRKLIAERKRDQDEVAEEQAILDLYRAALEGGRAVSSKDDDDDSMV